MEVKDWALNQTLLYKDYSLSIDFSQKGVLALGKKVR